MYDGKYRYASWKHMEVFPDPFHDQIAIRSGLPNVYRWSAVDALGKTISQGDTHGDTLIDTANWPVGFYFVRIEESGLPSIVFKVVKY
ncbi:MAG: T9SS type A sorting domain-containing protein [Saprospiraceae bacterium]